MIVPMVSSTLETNIRRSWDINTSFSPYSCIIAPISSLHTFVNLKLVSSLEIVLIDVLEIGYHTVHHQTMRLILSYALTDPGTMDNYKGKIHQSIPLTAY